MEPAAIDFLNHGRMPFCGRDKDLERIVAFWHSTADAQGLRLLLLLGEAGIGKSRLLEEAARNIVEAGGGLVHVRLYPDTNTSLLEPLARNIWWSGPGQRLLKRQPDASLADVAAALRRIARLRPTIVMIEDIHLLDGQPLAEFSSLLEVLCDEPISFLCPARPLDDAVRASIIRYTVEEVTLEGLPEAGIRQICRRLFGTGIGQDALDVLAAITAGNALALRSALQGAVSSQTIVPQSADAQWHVRVDIPTFRNSVARHVGLLLDGMAAHLGADERRAASLLASLGEVFSREAASHLPDVPPQMIDRLAFGGLLATSPVFRPPLFGTASTTPLITFTHTLVHHQLAVEAAPSGRHLLEILADNAPIYSVVPFEHISTITPSSADTCIRAINNMLDAAERLDTTADWRLADVVYTAASQLLEKSGHHLDKDQRRLLDARVVHTRLLALRRDVASQEHAQLVERLNALSSNPASPAMAELALHALHHGLWQTARREPERIAGVLESADVLFERFAELRLSRAYIDLLRDTANVAATAGRYSVGRNVESRLEQITASAGASAEFRQQAFQRIAPNLSWLMESDQEVERRLRDLEQIAAADPNDYGTRIWQITILDQLGRIQDAAEVARQSLPVFQAHGLEHFRLMGRVVALCAGAAIGEPLENTVSALRTLLAQASPDVAPRLRRNIGTRVSQIAMLCSRPDVAREAISEFLDGRHPWSLVPIWTSLGDDDPTQIATAVAATRDEIPDSLLAASRLVLEHDGTTVDDVIEQLRADLELRPLRLNDAITQCFTFDLLEAFSSTPPVAHLMDLQHQQIRTAVADCLDWFAANGLTAYMQALLARHGHRLDSPERTRWVRRIDSIITERAEREIESEKIELRMLGTIDLMIPGQDAIRLRSGRLRTLLGVLVADQMIERHLSLEEFRSIVADGNGDALRARKGTNLAVHRLREVVGHDAIITGGDNAPRLDTTIVHVDLLEAHRQLRQCERELQQGMLLRAYPALEQTLKIVDGEVPFPGLYNRFFEAAREEFEYRIHHAIVELANRLLGENQALAAISILRRAVAVLPGDDVVAELLLAALVRNGHNVDAARLQMTLDREAEIS